MGKILGSNYNLIYVQSSSDITTQVNKGLHRSGFIQGQIGPYKIEFALMNKREDSRIFTPHAGFYGGMKKNGIFFNYAKMVDEGIVHNGVRGKLIGGVRLNGVAFELSSRRSIFSDNLHDLELVLARNSQNRVTNNFKPLLEDYLHIATISMLLDTGYESKAQYLIDQWF